MTDKLEQLMNDFHMDDAQKNVIISSFEMMKDEALQQEQNKNIRLTSDIAHAIGYCRGLGHPETYLEKQYPELLPKE